MLKWSQSPKAMRGRNSRWRGSVRLDVGGPDHLAPLLGIFNDELAEFARRACKRLQTQIGEPRLELRAGDRLVNVLVEDRDGRRRGVSRRADTLPTARLVARHEIADR